MSDRLIQVRPCVEVDGQVTQTTESDAEFFGIYISDPVRWDQLMWIEDYKNVNDALEMADHFVYAYGLQGVKAKVEYLKGED